MKMLGRVTTAAMLMAVFVSPASAQRYWVDLGINGGGSWYSSLLGEDELGTDASAKFGPNWLVGSQLTIWPWSRVGIRANGTYTDNPFKYSNSDDVTIHDNVNLWNLTGDLLIRFKEPNESWQGTEILPYVALGAGATWYNPASDFFICNETVDEEIFSCIPFTAPPNTPGNPMVALAEESGPVGLVGIGTDIRFSPHVALRLELNDRFSKPEVERVASFAGGNIWNITDDEKIGKLQHQISAQVGVHLLLGLRGAAEQVAQAPPPPAPPPAEERPLPPPTPTPAPPPPPREEDITVCVIDPSASGGIRMQEAKFLVSSGDTVVVMNGNRVPLDEAVGNVQTAANADWYVRGTPFVMQMGNDRAEFVTYGASTTLQASDIAYVGMVNGVPVYADRDEVSALLSRIETARGGDPNADLSAVLAGDRQLREDFEDVKTFYVPLRATGCVFQPLLRQQQVRKGGKDLQ